MGQTCLMNFFEMDLFFLPVDTFLDIKDIREKSVFLNFDIDSAQNIAATATWVDKDEKYIAKFRLKYPVGAF